MPRLNPGIYTNDPALNKEISEEAIISPPRKKKKKLMVDNTPVAYTHDNLPEVRTRRSCEVSSPLIFPPVVARLPHTGRA